MQPVRKWSTLIRGRCITELSAKSERTGCYPDGLRRACWPSRESGTTLIEPPAKRNLGMTHKMPKTTSTGYKAEALAALILKQTEERAARAAEQAERYAQIDAARDAEIQSLIAEADAADAQILTPARRAEVIAVLCSYTGPLTKRGLPKRKPLNEHAGFRIEGWEKRECWPEVQGGVDGC